MKPLWGKSYNSTLEVWGCQKLLTEGCNPSKNPSALASVLKHKNDNIDIVVVMTGYNDTGDSGATVRRQFCGTCGSPVFTRVESPPGMMFIKAGTLDDTSILKPAFHCYTKSKQDWVELGDIPGFETVPQGL